MKLSGFSPVEERFFIESGNTLPTTRIPYIIASDFPKLRLLIALRFLEWVDESPEGDMFVPVSLNALSLLNSTFTNCYLSQVNAGR